LPIYLAEANIYDAHKRRYSVRVANLGKLNGKTALVTGASHGIGRAIAVALAKSGARTLVHFNSGNAEADRVVAQIRECGGDADKVAADLGKRQGPHMLAERVRSMVGSRPLDILVANAGVSRVATVEDTTIEDFDYLFAVNVRAPFFLVQQLLPNMFSGSSIILVSSLAARAAVSTLLPAYAASKGAIQTLVIQFAAALGCRGIRVNGIAPGVIQTEGSTITKTEAGRDATLRMQVLKRIADPDDIGGVAIFLASEDARWITGAVVPVDGGSKL
jgi:3-oxoacyl-[acyl-carrier protein] reductase